MACKNNQNFIKVVSVTALSFVLLSCNSTPSPEASQPKQPGQPIQGTSPSEAPQLQQPPSKSTTPSSPSQVVQSAETVQTSSVCSAPLIPSAITTEEIKLRERQIEIAKELETFSQQC